MHTQTHTRGRVAAVPLLAGLDERLKLGREPDELGLQLDNRLDALRLALFLVDHLGRPLERLLGGHSDPRKKKRESGGREKTELQGSLPVPPRTRLHCPPPRPPASVFPSNSYLDGSGESRVVRVHAARL